MNNETTSKVPLRTSESVNVLEQQILGLIKRDGAGQFYNVEPTVVEQVVEPVKKTVRKRTAK